MSNPSTTEPLDFDVHGDLYFGISLSMFYGLVLILLCLYPCYKHASKPDFLPDPDNKDYVGAFVREAWRVKTVYLIAVIHYLNTITDQLLLEWYHFREYFDRDGNGISFPSMIVFWIFIYRVLTGLYLYKYYNNKWYFAAQIIDVGIGFEVRESHMRYDVTNNLQYLSKLEQTFQTLPLVLIQVYVFFRILPFNLKYLSATTYWSIATIISGGLGKRIKTAGISDMNHLSLYMVGSGEDRKMDDNSGIGSELMEDNENNSEEDRDDSKEEFEDDDADGSVEIVDMDMHRMAHLRKWNGIYSTSHSGIPLLSTEVTKYRDNLLYNRVRKVVIDQELLKSQRFIEDFIV